MFKKKGKQTKARNAVAFLKGELLKDAYDDGHRFQYLLWNEEDKESDEAPVEETKDDNMRQRQANISWIDNLSNKEITAIWSELLSVRNLLPKHVPDNEYYVEIEKDGAHDDFQFDECCRHSRCHKMLPSSQGIICA